MPARMLETGIVEVSVSNPTAMNALSSTIISGLVELFHSISKERTTRVIIFRGAPIKGKYLSALAGADLSGLVTQQGGEYVAVPNTSARQHMEEGIIAIDRIRTFCARTESLTDSDPAGRIVVIGMVDGPCLAGGIEFMFGLSDIVLATPRSVFGMREILLGGMGGWRGPETLRRILCSPLWIKEMLLALGDQKVGDIKAETAAVRGLVNRLVPEDEIEEAVLRLARRVTKLDPVAVTRNLMAAEIPLGQDCTPAVTGWMVELMLRSAWVKGAGGFLARRVKG